MHINAELYFRSGIELGLPVQPIKDIYGFQVKMGRKRYFFRGGATPFNNGSTDNVANNKFCVNKLLVSAGFPVAKAIGITRKEFETDSWHMDDLTFPVVIKPTLGTYGGKDVLCNINDLKTLKYHLNDKFKEYQYLSVEEFHSDLTAYRVLVFYGKVIGVVKRIPAQVIGDGKNHILKLIEIENKNRQQFKDKVSFGALKIDEESKIILNEQKVTPHDIPEAGRVIKLCYNCNSTRGGSMISLGKLICKENASLLGKAAKALQLNIVGFDVLCEDINIPMTQTRGIIVEANYYPDLTIHEYPMKGEFNQVSKVIMRRFFYKHPFLGAYYFFRHKLCRFIYNLPIEHYYKVAAQQE